MVTAAAAVSGAHRVGMSASVHVGVSSVNVRSTPFVVVGPLVARCRLSDDVFAATVILSAICGRLLGDVIRGVRSYPSVVRESVRREPVVPPAWDVCLAGALALLGLIEIIRSDVSTPTPLLALCVVAVTAPVAWRRRLPLSATAVAVAASWVTPNSLDVPMFEFGALMVLCYSLGAYAVVWRAILGLASIWSMFAVGWLLDEVRHTGSHRPQDLVWVSVVFGGSWGLGLLGQRRRIRASLAEARADRLEVERDEQARRAVAEERSRIARELHDAVAHSVSVMVVQAGAAQELLDIDTGRVRSSLTAIQETGSQAVVELRRLLGILRTDDDEVLMHPQPGLGTLDSLIEQANTAGLSVTARIEGSPHAISAGVDLCAYRVVQEALTNAIKHAPGARAEISLSYGRDTLDIAIRDNGTDAMPGAGRSRPGTGHGLIGMRERVTLYGGTLQVGPSGSGYRVCARLPLNNGVS
jgi:signal transduction histidine kinase